MKKLIVIVCAMFFVSMSNAFDFSLLNGNDNVSWGNDEIVVVINHDLYLLSLEIMEYDCNRLNNTQLRFVMKELRKQNDIELSPYQEQILNEFVKVYRKRIHRSVWLIEITGE